VIPLLKIDGSATSQYVDLLAELRARGFEGDITTLSYFTKDGDYRLVRKVSARRIGDCPAGGAAPTAG